MSSVRNKRAQHGGEHRAGLYSNQRGKPMIADERWSPFETAVAMITAPAWVLVYFARLGCRKVVEACRFCGNSPAGRVSAAQESRVARPSTFRRRPHCERRGFTWAVLVLHSGPHARTIRYVRPPPSRSLGAPHPWPRVQPPRVGGPEMRRRRQRRLACRSLPVASPSDKRGTPLSNWGGCRAR
jgi:hypothetical protein